MLGASRALRHRADRRTPVLQRCTTAGRTISASRQPGPWDRRPPTNASRSLDRLARPQSTQPSHSTVGTPNTPAASVACRSSALT